MRQRPHLITWENIGRMLDKVPGGIFADNDFGPAPSKERFPWINDPLWRAPDDDQGLKE